MRRSRQFGIGKEGSLFTYPGFIKYKFILMEKSANSRARVTGRNGAGKGLLFHHRRKGKHMKRER